MLLTGTSGLYDKMVTLVIKREDGPLKFPVYSELAAHYSKKVEGYLDDNPEAKHVPILLEVAPELQNKTIFKYYVQFLNARTFWYLPGAHAEVDKYLPLVKLYQIAQELETAPLQNLVVKKIRLLFARSNATGNAVLISVPTINYIYSTTSRSSPLRQLAVDMWAFFGDKNDLFGSSRHVEVCAEFTVDFSKRVMDIRDDPELENPKDDAYLVHEVVDIEEVDDDEVIIIDAPTVNGYGVLAMRSRPDC
jgi:hypothetical protein